MKKTNSKSKNNEINILPILGVIFLLGSFIKTQFKLSVHWWIIPLLILGVVGVITLKLKFSKDRIKKPNRRNHILLFLWSLFDTTRQLFLILKSKRLKGFIFSKYFVSIIIFLIVGLYFKYSIPFMVLASFVAIYIMKFIYIALKLNRYQDLLNYHFNDSVFLKSWTQDKAVLLSYNMITDQDKPNLQLIFNTGVVGAIVQDTYNKRKFTLKLSYGLETKYTKLEKGSMERLTLILQEKGLKPLFMKQTQYDNSTVYEYTLSLNPRRIKYVLEDIENKLAISKRSLSISNDNGVFLFEITNRKNELYLLDNIIGKIQKQKEELCILVGINTKNSNPVVKDMVKINHLLIAGKSGSGKSTTLKAIIESLMYLNIDRVMFLMLDFGESALNRYKTFRNVKYLDLFDDNLKLRKDEIGQEINDLTTEMTRRLKLFKDKGVEKLSEYNDVAVSKLPYIIFAIDEANSFKNMFRLKDEDDMAVDIFRILSQGRKYGIFIIMGVQQTNDKQFFKDWKTQFTRLVHLLTEKIDVENATGNNELIPLVPNLKMGEFILDIKDSSEYEILQGTLTDKKYDRLFKTLERGLSHENTLHTKVDLDKTISR